MSDKSLNTSHYETARLLRNERRSVLKRLHSAIPIVALVSGILLTIAWSSGITDLVTLAVLHLVAGG